MEIMTVNLQKIECHIFVEMFKLSELLFIQVRAMVMQDMDISSTFNVEIHVPQLSKFEMKEVLHQQRAFSPAQVGPCMNEYSETEKSAISQVHVLSDAIPYLITLYAYHLTAA